MLTNGEKNDDVDQIFGALNTHRDKRESRAIELVTGVPYQERTLIVALLARSFLDAFEAVQHGSSPAVVVEWVDRMCDAHVDTPGIVMLFSEACTILGKNRGVSASERVLLRRLEPLMRAAASKPRQALPKFADHVNAVDAAINAMIVRLERADPLSAEHSRAVSAWCSRLARRLSLPESDVILIARCGLIHDVGKITTPINILHAPRKLTDDEWLVMRDHAPAGATIVLNDPLLLEFAAPVRSHHERLDGKGYPDGLPDDLIPLATRIVTVADCFNAMIGRRPYRLPMPPVTALAQLAAHSGTQFDPDVVEAMHDVALTR